jgi:O-antigen/teichoic acid export membrane protein
MVTQHPKNMPEEKKRMIRMILTLSGFVFTALGLACLIMPAGVAEMLGQDNNDTTIANILGAAFVMVGISDIAIARIIFKGNTNND